MRMGYLNWVSTTATDHDGDGCQDGIEDLDDDNDGIVDTSDTCPLGVINWISSASSDYDGDGCQILVKIQMMIMTTLWTIMMIVVME